MSDQPRFERFARALAADRDVATLRLVWSYTTPEQSDNHVFIFEARSGRPFKYTDGVRSPRVAVSRHDLVRGVARARALTPEVRRWAHQTAARRGGR